MRAHCDASEPHGKWTAHAKEMDPARRAGHLPPPMAAIEVPALQRYRLAAAVAAAGRPPGDFGLAVDLERPPEPIDRIRHAELAEALVAVAEAGLADIAIRLARTETPAQIDLAGGLILASACLRDGLDEAFRHWPLWGSMRFHHFARTPEGARLRFVAPAPAEPSLAWAICGEWTFAELVLGLRVLSGRAVMARRVQLTHPAALSAPGLDEVLGCAVEHDSAISALDLAADDLDAPLASHNLVLLQYFRAKVATLAGALDATPPITERLGPLLRQDLAVDLGTAAQRLALSPRALQRALRAEGTSFAHLVDDERRKRALELLDMGLAIPTIAERIGFSDARAFHRAFRRWTATTPRRWRRS